MASRACSTGSALTIMALTASCATWRPIQAEGSADLRDGVFVVMEDRALLVAVEAVEGEVVRGKLQGGCMSSGEPLVPEAIFGNETPQDTCERLGWDLPAAIGEPVDFKLESVVQARVYDPQVMQSAMVGMGGVLILALVAYAVVVASSQGASFN